jgi:hypothetical protein
VTQLEVRGESKRLSHRDVTPSLKHHHGNRMARESVSDDEFGNDVETDLLIGDCLDHTNRDNVDERCSRN